MAEENLGRLETVNLRDVWTNEAGDFTPWLAREENLSVLAETLGLELELEAEEKAVGPFRADILCRDTDSNAWVLVENQLERTDHNHLGQLLTYASGLQAVTIIWIASHFTEEHRATLDWLNRITDTGFHFFGLEVQLWRIGNSPPAPKFNIVSKPNDWSRSVAQAARALDEGEPTARRIMQEAYWRELQVVLDDAKGPIQGNRPPQRKPLDVISDRTRCRFRLGASMLESRQRVRVNLVIQGNNSMAFFHLLDEQRNQIEQELGYSLEWEHNPGQARQRIAIYRNADPGDQGDWPRQHEWLATHLNDFHRVFANRVQALDADDWQPVDNADEAPEG